MTILCLFYCGVVIIRDNMATNEIVVIFLMYMLSKYWFGQYKIITDTSEACDNVLDDNNSRSGRSAMHFDWLIP